MIFPSGVLLPGLGLDKVSPLTFFYLYAESSKEHGSSSQGDKLHWSSPGRSIMFDDQNLSKKKLHYI